MATYTKPIKDAQKYQHPNIGLKRSNVKQDLIRFNDKGVPTRVEMPVGRGYNDGSMDFWTNPKNAFGFVLYTDYLKQEEDKKLALVEAKKLALDQAELEKFREAKAKKNV
jgi:hypothetical protein